MFKKVWTLIWFLIHSAFRIISVCTIFTSQTFKVEYGYLRSIKERLCNAGDWFARSLSPLQGISQTVPEPLRSPEIQSFIKAEFARDWDAVTRNVETRPGSARELPGSWSQPGGPLLANWNPVFPRTLRGPRTHVCVLPLSVKKTDTELWQNGLKSWSHQLVPIDTSTNYLPP